MGTTSDKDRHATEGWYKMTEREFLTIIPDDKKDEFLGFIIAAKFGFYCPLDADPDPCVSKMLGVTAKGKKKNPDRLNEAEFKELSYRKKWRYLKKHRRILMKRVAEQRKKNPDWGTISRDRFLGLSDSKKWKLLLTARRSYKAVAADFVFGH